MPYTDVIPERNLSKTVCLNLTLFLNVTCVKLLLHHATLCDDPNTYLFLLSDITHSLWAITLLTGLHVGWGELHLNPREVG